MPTLREVQQAFSATLRDDRAGALADWIVADAFSAAERLGIYRNSSRSVLVDVLRIKYRAVDRLVGDAFFELAAERFCADDLPDSAYYNDYGGAFAAFLAVLPEAAGLHYLPDVARFEWALHCAANADDATFLDPASLAGVDPDRHGELCFIAHPSVRLLELDYPADAIADAVLAGDEAAMAAIDLASGPVRLVVNRGPHGVDACRLTLGEHRFAQRLFAGEALADLLESAECDGAPLLADHLIHGRLTGFRLAEGPEGESPL
jgi:hypothetical protein